MDSGSIDDVWLSMSWQLRDEVHARPLFACKTCNKKFSSFQALGGHRRSHSSEQRKLRSLKRSMSASDAITLPPFVVVPADHIVLQIEEQLCMRPPSGVRTRKVRKLFSQMSEKIESISNEVLVGLLAATCQNLPQTVSLTSCHGLLSRCILMGANGAGFLFLLCGMLRRSRRVGAGAGNFLILFGILLAATGIILSVSINISGMLGFAVPAACLLLVLSALLC